MKSIRAAILAIVAALSLSIVPAPACADSWALPTTTSYVSPGGCARITIVPRALEDQLSYFEDKVEKVEPAGQKAGGADTAQARLERRAGERWETVWEGRIVNEVAPVSAIVRDDGAYAVTFDNWHGVGYGPNVVAIYGEKGRLVRALSLTDLVPEDYVAALPRSVSSMRWRGEPRFSRDSTQVVIPVVIPGEEDGTVDFAISLADGRAAPTHAAAWQRALSKGRAVRAERLAAEAAAKAAFIAPLRGPTENTERAWHDYLREAVARRIGDDASAWTTVLRLPGAKDYAVSETWVREYLTDRGADMVALASLSEPNLARVLTKVGATLPRHSLVKTTVFVAVSDQHWPTIVLAMRQSGAKLVQLDPQKPIAQRPERIAQLHQGD